MSETKKSGCLGKVLKVLLWGFVAVLLLIALMPLWISPVVTTASKCVVPMITGTPFSMDRCYVNPWTGAVRINGVKLSNPEGFGEAPAVSVQSVSVDIALFALFSNKLHLKDVTIVDPFASYFSHNGTNNIDFILANVEDFIGKKDEEEEKTPSEMKIIIDHFKVTGTKVKLMESDMIPPLPIIPIELNDIGKESDGVSFAGAWDAISDAFMKGMSSVGDGLGALGGLLGGAASATGDGAKATAGAVSDGAKAAAGAVSDGAKAATEGVKNLFKNIGK